MYKKSVSRVIAGKKAQITIFIILGLLVLFAFIFVFSLSSGIKKGQLQEAQEKVLTGAFKKEALRIFVEYCLRDELEEGLNLIGRQGRLWDDQPGGTRHFEEGVTGRSVGDYKVFYGLTNDTYLQYPNAYPCSNELNSPEFCQYRYPNTTVGFGSLELRVDTLKTDLRRYLVIKAQECVEKYAQSAISAKAEVETEKVDLALDLFEEGIAVKINYPLKLRLGGEEFFHLSQFDFFYPSRFKALLDAAVTFPLRWDWQYADFAYDKKTLESPFFTHGNEVEVKGGNCLASEDYFWCNLALRSDLYSSLGIKMNSEKLDNGDTLFSFQSPEVLENKELYTYQFVRQNRPPALDYVHRKECPAAGYDYLVIPGDEELGQIELDLFALDPDEDKPRYFIDNKEAPEKEKQVIPAPPQQKEPYTLTVSAEDEHGARDWQDVRVLVDRPLDLGISLNMPYKFWSSAEKKVIDYQTIFPIGGAYAVSDEDPAFIEINFPETSLSSVYKQAIVLDYAHKDENFKYTLPDAVQITDKGGCFSFPGLKSKDCTLKEYTEDDLKNWDSLYSSEKDFNHFRALGSGKLTLSLDATYCSLFDKSKSQTANVVVQECLPHRNQQHPFAYPYGKYTFTNYDFDAKDRFEESKSTFTGIKDAKINPFEATHSCCTGVADPQLQGQWRLSTEKDDPCFINPEPGCYGQVEIEKNGKKEPYTGILGKDKHYLWEVQQRLCDNQRGNVCGGDFSNELYNQRLWCGGSEQKITVLGKEYQCATIPPECEKGPAFKLDEEKKGWCHGNFGCSDFCKKPVAYIGPSKEKSFDINIIATKVNALDDENVFFHCGCVDGNNCDFDYDGEFNGVCKGDVCEGDI